MTGDDAFSDHCFQWQSYGFIKHCGSLLGISDYYSFFPWTKHLSFCNFYSLVLFIPSASQNKFLFHFATFIPTSLQLIPFHTKEYQFLRLFLYEMASWCFTVLLAISPFHEYLTEDVEPENEHRPSENEHRPSDVLVISSYFLRSTFKKMLMAIFLLTGKTKAICHNSLELGQKEFEEVFFFFSLLLILRL